MSSVVEAPAKRGTESRERVGREPRISVVVPVTERPGPLGELYQVYAAAIRGTGRPFEFVFVVAPWFQQLTRPLTDLAARGEPPDGL